MSYEASVDEFSRRLESVSERAANLYGRTEEMPSQQSELLVASLEELREALEELHVAEEELRQQHEAITAVRAAVEMERQRYKELFEFAPDGYLVTDAQGIVREANSAAATLLNISRRFLVGKSIVNFVVGEERIAFRNKLNQLHLIERLQEWEVQFKARGDKLFDASLSVACVRDW